MDEILLCEAIEELRSKLILLVREKGSYTHEEVIEISHQLDVLIFRYQQRKSLIRDLSLNEND